MADLNDLRGDNNVAMGGFLGEMQDLKHKLSEELFKRQHALGESDPQREAALGTAISMLDGMLSCWNLMMAVLK